jgi:hypothetical protein
MGGVAVTLVVMAYNQEQYITAAIEAAFAQDYPNLEIILSDDCSHDGTFQVMADMAGAYAGPHRVRARRSEANRGLVRHFLEAVTNAHGDLIVLAAGDDISLTERSRNLAARWEELGRPTAVVYSDYEPIDEEGRPAAAGPERINPGPFTLAGLAGGSGGPLGATCAISKNLLTSFPPIDQGVTHEDRVFPFRALLLGGVVSFVDRKLVRYRVEGGHSRKFPKSLRDYVTDYASLYHRRLLPDARQRLEDALHARPEDEALHRLCRATIVDHEARLAMADGKRLAAKLGKYLVGGARPVPLLKHVLKFPAGTILERLGRRGL